MTTPGGTRAKGQGVPRVPTGAELRETGTAAWKRSIQTLIDRGLDAKPYLDTVLRYARAVDDEEGARQVWVDAGRPTLTLGGATGAAEVEHPLVKIVRDAAKLANDFAKQLGLDPVSVQRTTAKRVGPGRPMGAASSFDRQTSSRGRMDAEPARITQLTAVKGGKP